MAWQIVLIILTCGFWICFEFRYSNFAWTGIFSQTPNMKMKWTGIIRCRYRCVIALSIPIPATRSIGWNRTEHGPLITDHHCHSRTKSGFWNTSGVSFRACAYCKAFALSSFKRFRTPDFARVMGLGACLKKTRCYKNRAWDGRHFRIKILYPLHYSFDKSQHERLWLPFYPYNMKTFLQSRPLVFVKWFAKKFDHFNWVSRNFTIKLDKIKFNWPSKYSGCPRKNPNLDNFLRGYPFRWP